MPDISWSVSYCLTMSQFQILLWYLFNFIENGLNVKDKRCFGEKKKLNYFTQGSETGYQMDVHRKGQNESFQEGQSTEWF